MNKLQLICIAFLMTFFLNSSLNGEALQMASTGLEGQIIQKVELSNCVVFLMEDQSVWQGAIPSFEQQTWSEWLLGRSHMQPDPRFYFLLSNWSEPTLVRFYQLDNSINSPFPYLAENLQTGEFVFVKPIQSSELFFLLLQYGKEQFSKGFACGQCSCSPSDMAPDIECQ